MRAMVRLVLALLVAVGLSLGPVSAVSAKARCHMAAPAMQHHAPMKGDACSGHKDKASCAQACATVCATLSAVAPVAIASPSGQ